MGKFEPLTEHKDGGCDWLGREYCKKFGGVQSISVQSVLKGILSHPVMKKAGDAAAQPIQQHLLKMTDQDIKEIVAEPPRHSMSSDASRRHIFKTFTEETPLYSQVNKAL